MAILKCENLTKRYGSTVALSDVNFSIEPGTIVGLLGPNGSGKTTLLKLANGLLTPTAGSILIDGNAPGVESKKIVSYLPERTYLPNWMTIKGAIKYFTDFYADFSPERAMELIAKLGIDEKKHIRQLSKGTREKVQLILVMSRKAKLYLLDEPIGGVDPATRDYILTTIIANYDSEAAVVISTHLIADVESILSDVIFINAGKILLQENVDVIREKFNKSIDEYFREVFRC